MLFRSRFGSGGIVLDSEAARRAIDLRVGEPLGLSTVEAARAIREVLDSAMADLMRSVTIERGHDPREFLVVAGGGSGPSHAWALCRELGLDGFVVPATATAQSAFGAGTSDLRTTASRTCYVRLSGGVAPGESHSALVASALRDTAGRVLSAIPSSDATELSYTAAVRYHGQAHHLDVALEADPDSSTLLRLLDRFEADYEMLFGKGAGYREAGFEILSVRAVAAQHSRSQTSSTSSQPFETRDVRPVVFDDANTPEETTVYGCDWPSANQFVSGPCLIQLPGCVVVVPPGGSAATDSLGAIHVKLGQQ